MAESPTEREILAAALRCLERGESRRFQDLLWLGFGDRWQPIEAWLLRKGYTRPLNPERTMFGLTEDGAAAIRTLENPATRIAS